jgi:hypothetical protein
MTTISSKSGHTIGRRQRAILAALKRGATLKRDAAWRYIVTEPNGRTWPAPRESCLGLHLRGYLMADKDGETTVYTLTEKGKR